MYIGTVSSRRRNSESTDGGTKRRFDITESFITDMRIARGIQLLTCRVRVIEFVESPRSDCIRNIHNNIVPYASGGDDDDDDVCPPDAITPKTY